MNTTIANSANEQTIRRTNNLPELASPRGRALVRAFARAFARVLALTAVASTAACVAATDPMEPEPADPADEQVGQVSQALPTQYCEKDYYSDASMTTYVGFCTSSCISTAYKCTGTKTSFFTTQCFSCSTDP